MSCITSDSSQSGLVSSQPEETVEHTQQRHPLGPRSFSASRSTTRPAMGHSGARAPAPPPLPLDVTSSSQDESSSVSSGGSKWKRAWKLKRPEDSSTSLSPSSPSKNKTLAAGWKNRPKLTSESEVSLSDQGSTSGTASSPRVQLSARALASSTFDILRGKKSPMSPTFSSPPPPPPKSPMTLEYNRTNPNLNQYKASSDGNPVPIISSDVRIGERDVSVQTHSDQTKDLVGIQEEQIQLSKDDWRKSDATVKHVSNRTPSRPLSVAESSHSGHTVMPAPVGSMSAKRLSAMLTDADYATPEEDLVNGCSSLPSGSTGPLSKSISSPSKSTHRRSMSMNIGGISYRNVLGMSQSAKEDVSTYSSAPGMTQGSSSLGDVKHPSTAPVGYYGMEHSRTPSRTTIASSTTDTSSGSSTKWSSNAALPPTGFRSADSHLMGKPKAPTKLRQTAISMSNGLAKLGRVIAHGSSVTPLTASHSANGNPPTSFFSVALRRTASNQSDSAESGAEARNKSKKRTKTPNAPSGTWSLVSSSGGQSDNEGSLPTASGPHLGVPIRAPFSLTATGYVFGRPLVESVKDTAIDSVRSVLNSASLPEASESELLETRRLPALVFRCAKHILKWGIQEEGLFRVPGRQSHTSRLRSEFDSGADYDMSECGPGDLDPHAVGSLFKAFLRELPEPVLTRSLAPEFDAALSVELTAPPSPEIGKGLRGMGGPAMPANPRAGFQMALRKPPSLSTLSQPIFSTRSPSEVLVNSLSGLVARLPAENRDLLRTLTELIRTTADNHKETKMPLGNLLLIFCPSLGMSPSLLKVLCEADIRWTVPQSIQDGVVPAANGVETDTADAVGERDQDVAGDTIVSDRNGRDRTPVATMYLSKGRTREPDPSHDIDSDNIHTTPLQIRAPNPNRYPTVDDSNEDPNILGANRPICTSPWASSSESSSLVTDHSVIEDHAAVHSIEQPALKLDESALALKQLQDELIAASIGKSPRRYPSFNGPVQFPLISPSAPVTPTSPRSRLTLSTYSSSSPDLGPSLGQSLGRRMKKPSLQLLLHKRSITSLLSRPQSVALSPSSSPSSPLSPNVISVAPPVLDMKLQYSPLKINIDGITDEDRDCEDQPNLNAFVEQAYMSADSNVFPTTSNLSSNRGIRNNKLAPPLSSPEMSHSSSNSSTYYTPMTRLAPSLLSTPSQTSQNSTGSYSLLDLELSKEDKEDWAKSVLLAADAGLHS